MESLQSLYDDIVFRLFARTWIEQLDLILVFITFYLLLVWAQRRQAAFLLRGALLLGIFLFIITIILPLPTFDWLVRGALLAIVIPIPIIFQPEIRRFLERIGRTVGISFSTRHTAAENTLAELARAVEYFAANQIGVLIAIEGNDSLNDIIQTGVRVTGPVTQDLLQAIFYGENPLHDGAVIVHEDRVLAAGCVLPLTTRPLLQPGRRLGTRHRAAVGLSETSDALVIVVSEETGEISVARNGAMHRPLTLTRLREQLFNFYMPRQTTYTSFSIRKLIREFIANLRKRPLRITPRELWGQIGLMFVAFLLALTVWAFVIEQTNPARRVAIEDIPLRVEGQSAELTLMTDIPNTIDTVIETTENAIIRHSGFQAIVSLADLQPGLHQIEVQVNSGISPIRILSVDPSSVDLELAQSISRTFTVSPEITNEDRLPSSVLIVRAPTTNPGEVQVTGPEPLVSQINQVRARISVANATASLNEFRPLDALNEQGEVIDGVTIDPAQVQVSVGIQRRFNALDVGVRAVIENTPPPNYWLSSVQVIPASVTLQGNREQLNEIENFVSTFPVDISEALGDFTIEIPLNLPADLQAIDGDGNAIKTVTVIARITPRSGDLVITKSIPIIGPNREDATIDPTTLRLLLSGPLPTLNEIEANPELVQVFVDITGLEAEQNIEPLIIVPDGIEVQPVPPSVLLVLP